MQDIKEEQLKIMFGDGSQHMFIIMVHILKVVNIQKLQLELQQKMKKEIQLVTYMIWQEICGNGQQKQENTIQTLQAQRNSPSVVVVASLTTGLTTQSLAAQVTILQAIAASHWVPCRALHPIEALTPVSLA